MMRPSTFFFLTRRGVRNLGKHWAMTIACIASLSVCMTLNIFASLAEVNVGNMVAYLGSQNETVVYLDPACDDAILIHNLLDDEVQLIANLHQVFDLGGGIIGQLAQLDKAGLLRTDIHLDLVGRDAGHDSFHNTACMNPLFFGCVQHLLKAHAVIDFCAHTVKYLLNNRRWR